MLGKRRTRPAQRERQYGHSGLDRKPKSAILEWKQLGGLGAGSLREDHHRDPLPKRLTAALHGLDRTGTEAALHRNVSGQPHHPSHDRDPKELGLGEPLHFPGQVTDQEDICERFMVGDDHVRMPGVLRHGSRVAKLPERVQCSHCRPDPTEDVPDDIAASIERSGHQQQNEHYRKPDQNA